MRKIIALLLFLCLCVSLSACGKSEAVKNVENAISSIGEVTLDSEELIKNAEKLYGILTDEEKTEIAELWKEIAI